MELYHKAVFLVKRKFNSKDGAKTVFFKEKTQFVLRLKREIQGAFGQKTFGYNP